MFPSHDRGVRKGIVLDDATLSPNSAAYKTTITNSDIQTVQRGIAQESKYNTGCSFRDNLIQDITRAAGDTDTKYAYYLGGYENYIGGGYVETPEDGSGLDKVVFLATTARNNLIDPFYYGTSEGTFLEDTGSSNVINYFGERAVTITGISQASPAVLTTDIANNLRSGEKIIIRDVVGMTEVNGTIFTYTPVTATTGTIGIDSTSYTAYSSGGVASVTYKTKRSIYSKAPIDASIKFDWVTNSAFVSIGDLASSTNLTRTDVGDYTVTFDTPYLTDDYHISISLDTNSSGHAGNWTIISHGKTNH